MDESHPTQSQATDWIEGLLNTENKTNFPIDPFELYPLEDSSRLDPESARNFYQDAYDLYPTGNAHLIGAVMLEESLAPLMKIFNKPENNNLDTAENTSEQINPQIELFLRTHPIVPFAIILPSGQPSTYVLRTITNVLMLVGIDASQVPAGTLIPAPSTIWTPLTKMPGTIGYLSALEEAIRGQYSNRQGVKIHLNSANLDSTPKQIQRLISCYQSAVAIATEYDPRTEQAEKNKEIIANALNRRSNAK